jgi:4'-phosphopantetheinyl transferase
LLVEVDGVRIWKADLDSMPDADLEELGALLDSVERARGARFHFEQDRRHYVATRGLLRSLLGAELDKSPSTLVFEYGSRGKPSIAVGTHERVPRFNVSHSSGWAMFALAWDREVGIDLECGSRLERDENSLSQLAARILSSRELATWHDLPNDAQRRVAFLRAWTRKEAYAKATGQGVFDELDRIEVALDAASPKSSLTLPAANAEGRRRGWTIHDLSAPDGFAAALVIEQEPQSAE